MLAVVGRYAEARDLGERVVAQAPAAPMVRGLGGSSFADAWDGLATALTACNARGAKPVADTNGSAAGTAMSASPP